MLTEVKSSANKTESVRDLEKMNKKKTVIIDEFNNDRLMEL